MTSRSKARHIPPNQLQPASLNRCLIPHPPTHPNSGTILADSPRAATAVFVGREIETAVLEDAWHKAVRGDTPRPLVITLLGLGGVGKSTLVAKWADGLANRGWPGCEAAFAWSFYSQGAHEYLASSDKFVREAIAFFGDPRLANRPVSDFEKGRRLGELVGGKRALLILDGIEPLQSPPSSPTGGGRIRDPAVAALLRVLAVWNRGLCLVTTRYTITDLEGYRQATTLDISLAVLNPEEGQALLRSLGVKGTKEELVATAQAMGGHALALTLLGTYIVRVHGGDIQQARRIAVVELDRPLDSFQELDRARVRTTACSLAGRLARHGPRCGRGRRQHFRCS